MDFSDDTENSEVLCVFEGRWNPSCGGDDLGASFVGDTDTGLLAMALTTEPVVGLGALVTSPTTADLVGLFPNLEDPEGPFELLFGSVELAENGNTLIIDPVEPSEAPFAIDGCTFVEYRGSFTMTVPVNGAAGTTTAPNLAINALRMRQRE